MVLTFTFVTLYFVLYKNYVVSLKQNKIQNSRYKLHHLVQITKKNDAKGSCIAAEVILNVVGEIWMTCS